VTADDFVCVVLAGKRHGVQVQDRFEILRDGKVIAHANPHVVLEVSSFVFYRPVDGAHPRAGDVAVRVPAEPAP